MTNTFENGRRQVARECLKELTNLPKYDDKAVTEILDKYTPKFKPLNHMRFSAKSVLAYYVRVIRKEMKDG
ncbi:hypothetical protein A9255_08050 [Xenorhabdus hominickii]|uniref:Uncharacterized protein n=1 Tax=Xenorhabdus hominickii TaxID=351679 RepID=A0A2G0QBH4_XENHO|nr:hypothetical protein A9255_08050 [Xenorhabdus hominickii]PHM56509.1 hypothetical protein Xhom_02002 [Xenorhabdus hominickii]